MITREMSAEERLQYCRDVVAEQEQSGMSIRKWCAEKGMPTARFHRYKRFAQGKTNEKAEQEGGVYQIPAADPRAASDMLVAESGGIKVMISGEADWDKACSVLRALQRTC